jgi:hypothetical protein
MDRVCKTNRQDSVVPSNEYPTVIKIKGTNVESKFNSFLLVLLFPRKITDTTL